MLSFRTLGYNGYAVKYSPFFDNKLAVSSSSNFGLVGNGRLFILDIDPSGKVYSPISWETQDGLFDVAWSEVHENQLVASSGDGSIKLFDLSVGDFPVMNFKEHKKEVFSVSWNLVDKVNFVSASWDGTMRIWSPSRPDSLMTLHTRRDASSKLYHGKNMTPSPQVYDQKSQKGAPIDTSDCNYNCIFSPHSPFTLLSCNGSSHLQVWDIRVPNPMQVDFIGHGGMEALTCDWNKYKSSVIASAGTDKRIRIWDLRMITKIDNPSSSALMPSYHMRGPSPLNELVGHDFAIRKITWSPHSAQELLSASYDMTCRVWKDESNERARFLNSSTGGCVGVMSKHREFVIGCDYSLWGDPGWAASTGWDEMVYIWDSKRLSR